MEIIAIEKQTLKQLIQRFEDFAKQINTLCGKNRVRKDWLNNMQFANCLKSFPVPCQLTEIREFCLFLNRV